MELSNEHVIDLFERLGRIEQQLEGFQAGGPSCAVHSEQIATMRRDLDDVRSQQAKHNIIAATLGVIGASIVLTIKYVAGKL